MKMSDEKKDEKMKRVVQRILKTKKEKEQTYERRIRMFQQYRKELGIEQQLGREITKLLDDLESCSESG